MSSVESLMTGSVTAARRLGLFLVRTDASIWIHGVSKDAFQAARRLIYELQHHLTGYRWMLTTPDAAALTWLQERYVDDSVYPAPLPSPSVASRFFRAASPRVLIVLGSADGLPDAVWAKALQRNLPIVWTDVDASILPQIRRWSAAFDRAAARTIFCVAGEDVRSELQRLGLPASAIVVTGTLREEPQHGVEDKILTAVESGLDLSSMKRRRGEARLIPTFRDKIGESRIWKRAAAFWTRRRIEDLDALRRRLGNPETILCLGNGPSSEDPAVREVRYDALFRVNHIWQKRGRLLQPHVVFVGTPQTLRKVKPCIYGFSSVSKEYGMVLRNLWSSGLEPMEYFTVEQLCGFDEWTPVDKLSNGALMVVAAAALRPKRLVIAGIDLYLHADGRYPGDSHANNNIAPVHDRNTEVETIAAALRDFPNETVIIGDVLRKSLERMCAGTSSETAASASRAR